MSISRNCDVCGGNIDLKEDVPILTLPVDWLKTIGEDPDSPPMDVCGTNCLLTAAAALDKAFGEAEQAFAPADEEGEEEEHPLLPQASTRLDPDLQPRYFGPGDADGVVMRS